MRAPTVSTVFAYRQRGATAASGRTLMRVNTEQACQNGSIVVRC